MRYHHSVPTYHVENFGCRATQADGAALERQFEARGLTHAAGAQADVVLLNTCTVTTAADQDARAAIRRVQRQNPTAKIIVTGCYAQRAPEEIAALPGVTAVVGNSHKHQLADLVLPGLVANRKQFLEPPAQHDSRRTITASSTFLPLAALTESRELRTGIAQAEIRQPKTEARLYVSDIFAHTELLAAPVFESASEASRTRPNLKVQDGCDNRCSFCVIPSVRGQSRSLHLPQIIREVNALVAAGYKELVISGINLGRWGRDLRGEIADFEFLLQAILDQTALEKLRISSVEPMDWSDKLIRLAASFSRIAKHAHVPLQSGSDSVLRRMHRKYRPWHYREKIEKIRAAMPSAAIGADVMTGFPGETEAEFEATRRLIEDLPLTYLHVFTFSARPGTPAAAMAQQVPVHIARERNRILRDLGEQKKKTFMARFAGASVEAITLQSHIQRNGEGNGKGGAHRPIPLTEALTDNFLKLHLPGAHPYNQWVRALIEGVTGDALCGKVLPANEPSELPYL